MNFVLRPWQLLLLILGIVTLSDLTATWILV